MSTTFGDVAGAEPILDVDLRAAIDRLPDAIVLADARGVVILVNRAAVSLFGYAAEDLVGRRVTELMPQRYRPAHVAGFSRFLRHGTGRLVDGPPARVAALRADGSEVDIDLSLSATAPIGDPSFAIAATLRDAREQVVLERQVGQFQHLQASIEASNDGVLAVSPERRVLAVNRRFCEMWRLPENGVMVGDVSPLVLRHCLAQVEDPSSLRTLVSEGYADPDVSFQSDIVMTDGRWLVATSAPLTDDAGSSLGRVWYLRDDTERRQAETHREDLLDRLRAVQRSQAFLLQASDVLARASSYAETMERMAAIAVPALADLCLIDVTTPTGSLLRMAARHADPRKRDLVEELHRHYPPSATGPHPSVTAIATRESRYSPDMSEEFLRHTTQDDRHYQLVKELEFTSYMAVPLVAEGQAMGCVTLVSAGSGRRFGPADLALAEELASRLAQVVVRARRYDREHLASHALQSSLLPPRPPALPGLTSTARYLPGTTGAEVGGDFYDVVALDNGAVALTVGDVTGHDLTAAASMGQLRAAFRALLAVTEGPADLIARMQRGWRTLGLPRLATALFARLDPVTGDLQVASAGHPPPMLVANGTAWFPPIEPASPLGAPPVTAAQWHGELPPGGSLVLYTDGLIERRGEDIDAGMRRLAAVSRDAPLADPDQLCDLILAEMLEPDRGDDVALLVVCRPLPQ